MLPQLENIGKVAAALKGIPERFVFAGAGILPLLLDTERQSTARPTVDTDVVVPVLHYAEWTRLRDELVVRGFRERADARAVRQILFWLGELQVDFIPAQMKEFGTENRWLAIGFAIAEPHQLDDGTEILCLSADAWLAAKLAAFDNRGRGDPWKSRDLEDIVALLAGRGSIVEDVKQASPQVTHYVGEQLRAMSRQTTILDAMDGLVSMAEHRVRLHAIRSAIANE